MLDRNMLTRAICLQEFENWNQTPNDWLRLLDLEPRGCLGAWINNQLVGVVTTITYGQDLAWIGMMLVDPQYRRRGIATQLMNHAIGFAREAGVKTVKLDATEAGLPLYRKLGFISEGFIERWKEVARRQPRPSGVGTLARNDLTEVLQLDLKAFHADRSQLLESLIKDSCVAPVTISGPSGEVCGYALAREGKEKTYLGPIVAVNEASALALLDSLLNQLVDKTVCIDVAPQTTGASTSLQHRGFVKERQLVRMHLGPPAKSVSPEFIFAIAGPELG